MGPRFIPTELGWNVLVLITKANADTWGIGLLEVVWKVVEAVIETWIKSLVQFHNEMHGFCAGREAGTAITELKPAQELEIVYPGRHIHQRLPIPPSNQTGGLNW